MVPATGLTEARGVVVIRGLVVRSLWFTEGTSRPRTSRLRGTLPLAGAVAMPSVLLAVMATVVGSITPPSLARRSMFPLGLGSRSVQRLVAGVAISAMALHDIVVATVPPARTERMAFALAREREVLQKQVVVVGPFGGMPGSQAKAASGEEAAMGARRLRRWRIRWWRIRWWRPVAGRTNKDDEPEYGTARAGEAGGALGLGGFAAGNGHAGRKGDRSQGYAIPKVVRTGSVGFPGGGGGSWGGPGGGAAGLSGALFVESRATVRLQRVHFLNNEAKGGEGEDTSNVGLSFRAGNGRGVGLAAFLMEGDHVERFREVTLVGNQALQHTGAVDTFSADAVYGLPVSPAVAIREGTANGTSKALYCYDAENAQVGSSATAASRFRWLLYAKGDHDSDTSNPGETSPIDSAARPLGLQIVTGGEERDVELSYPAMPVGTRLEFQISTDMRVWRTLKTEISATQARASIVNSSNQKYVRARFRFN